MKILTPEEEAAHDRATWEGGILGAVGGLAGGSLGVWAASKRSHAFRQLSIPFRAFLILVPVTFGGVVTADSYSRAFQQQRHADYGYVNKSETTQLQLDKDKSTAQRAKEWVSEQRYPIVFGSWVASMGIAFGIVNRNQFLTGAQKLVQARVYAQGLTLAVLLASFGLESNDMRVGKGRWETVKILDPEDPDHKRIIEKRIHHEAYSGEDQWMDMIEAQEKKDKARAKAAQSKSQN